MKLNLGCGKKILPGYTNVDLYVDHPLAVKWDVRALPLADASVDEILAEDLLEHFHRFEWRAALAEWVRVLKPGGAITIQSPDMLMLATAMLGAAASGDDAKWEDVNRRLFGGQGDGEPDPHKAMYHFTGFHVQQLARHCVKEHGLAVEDVSHYNLNFRLTMRKP